MCAWKQSQHRENHRDLGKADADDPSDRLGLALSDLQCDVAPEPLDRQGQIARKAIDCLIGIKAPDAEFSTWLNDDDLRRSSGIEIFGERLDLLFGKARALELEDRDPGDGAMMNQNRAVA